MRVHFSAHGSLPGSWTNCQIRDIDHLKERLIHEWRRFDQCIIDKAVGQWRQRLLNCTREKGGHFDCQI